MSRARDFADLAASADAGGLTGRNLIINGAMQVAQRGTSSANVTSAGYQTLDRFSIRQTSSYLGTGIDIDISQATDAPTGFKNSYKVAVQANDTPTANEALFVEYRAEGQDVAHLGFGTSGAKSVTLSFYVKAGVTGTYSVALRNGTGDRVYIAEYTVSSADTWEEKVITFSGSTDGTWATDNTAGFRVRWTIAGGSGGRTAGSYLTASGNDWSSNQVNGMVSGKNWLITGVQLELGSQATPFEHRSFGDELARCQRYYSQFDSDNGGWIAGGFFYNTTAVEATVRLPQRMRAAPTVSIGGTENHIVIQRAATSNAGAGSTQFNQATTVAYNLSTTADGSSTTGNGTNLRVQNTAILKHDAEL